MYALNPTHSPEKCEFWVWADPFGLGAGHARSALKTSVERPPGVSDGIEAHNGRQETRRATSKGSWGKAQRSTRVRTTNVTRGVRMAASRGQWEPVRRNG
uniref:Uncharacterized protein n=1 Tax=Candidatus Kentrum sp. UNK TaxID=2126344 RepID=A0A451ATK8_9GAMM|nr:MAG: hypothetical protein BECKUNK1418G_GA0071005_13782 [Candidatus Kentron sp. UNK]